MISIGELHDEAIEMLRGAPEGEELEDLTATLVGLAVHSSVTTLDLVHMEDFMRRALDAGATAAQVHETLVLVSALGVHSLMEGSPVLASILRSRGDGEFNSPLDDDQQAIWAEHVGEDEYWSRFEQEVPGFLQALLRFSPAAFRTFFEYCAIPWKSQALSSEAKELLSMAVDASPTHRYLPGMRLHLMNALRLGAGRRKILGTLKIAAAASSHQGVR